MNNPGFTEDCKIWAERGYCTDSSMGNHYTTWMKRNCMVSCGVCTPGASTFKTIIKIMAIILFYAWILNYSPLSRPLAISLLFLSKRWLHCTALFVGPLIIIYFL